VAELVVPFRRHVYENVAKAFTAFTGRDAQ